MLLVDDTRETQSMASNVEGVKSIILPDYVSDRFKRAPGTLKAIAVDIGRSTRRESHERRRS